MLALPKCPDCGGSLPVREFLRAARAGRGRHRTIAHNAGLMCPRCGARLRPSHGRYIAVQSAALLGCAGAVGLAALSLGRSWSYAVPLQIILILGTIVTVAMLEPRLMRFVEAPDDARLTFPLGTKA